MEPIQDDNKYNLYHIIHISADTLTTVVEDQKKLKSFGIPILWLWTYRMKIIPEMR